MADGQDITIETPQDAASVVPSPEPVDGADESVSIPIEQMGDYGKDFHGLLKDVKAYRQANEAGLMDADVHELVQFQKQSGLTTKAFLEALQDKGAVEDNSALESSSEPATAEGIAAMKAGLKAELQSEANYDKALSAEHAYRDVVLSKAGYGEDGKKSLVRLAKSTWENVLADVIKESIPQFASDEDRENSLNSPATVAQLNAAKRAFAAEMLDVGNEFTAQAANKQQTQPSGTLGGDGPTGSVPEKSIADMTYKELVAHHTKDAVFE